MAKKSNKTAAAKSAPKKAGVVFLESLFGSAAEYINSDPAAAALAASFGLVAATADKKGGKKSKQVEADDEDEDEDEEEETSAKSKKGGKAD